MSEIEIDANICTRTHFVVDVINRYVVIVDGTSTTKQEIEALMQAVEPNDCWQRGSLDVALREIDSDANIPILDAYQEDANLIEVDERPGPDVEEQQEYGSLQNLTWASNPRDYVPTVGEPLTVFSWTDRHVGRVTSVDFDEGGLVKRVHVLINRDNDDITLDFYPMRRFTVTWSKHRQEWRTREDFRKVAFGVARYHYDAGF